jgi:KDO2-lipid IV(A) lauroyltransferase
MTLLLRWLSYWPLGWVQRLGAGVGWLAWALSPTYRRRVALNAQMAGLTTAQRQAAVLHAGRMSGEIPWLWFRQASRPLGELIAWDGHELVEQALAAGKGLVLLTPHLGGFEFAARGYAERFGARQPITVLYRPAKQAMMAEIQTYSRTAPGMQAAPATLAGVRQMLRALRKGETVGLLPDQVPPKGQGAWVPFFGQPAYTMTLAARLVQQTGCALLLTWAERLPSGQGFRLKYRPLPVALPAAEAGEDASALVINQAMEWVIAQCPEQYMWGYNRYKNPRSVEPTPPVASGGAA